MSESSRRVFLIICVVVPFLLYCIYYYAGVFRDAPFRRDEFVSMNIQYGDGPVLKNSYDSKTEDYQYVNTKDSVIKMKIHLTKDDITFIHHKAFEQGFWDFPAIEGDTTVKSGAGSLRYIITLNYKRKTKKVIFYNTYDGDPKLVDANRQVISNIEKVLQDEEKKQSK